MEATGVGAYLYSPVFPQGLSFTHALEGVRVLCVSEAVPGHLCWAGRATQPLGGLQTAGGAAHTHV